jgi:hypothetical protein
MKKRLVGILFFTLLFAIVNQASAQNNDKNSEFAADLKLLDQTKATAKKYSIRLHKLNKNYYEKFNHYQRKFIEETCVKDDLKGESINLVYSYTLRELCHILTNPIKQKKISFSYQSDLDSLKVLILFIDDSIQLLNVTDLKTQQEYLYKEKQISICYGNYFSKLQKHNKTYIIKKPVSKNYIELEKLRYTYNEKINALNRALDEEIRLNETIKKLYFLCSRYNHFDSQFQVGNVTNEFRSIFNNYFQLNSDLNSINGDHEKINNDFTGLQTNQLVETSIQSELQKLPNGENILRDNLLKGLTELNNIKQKYPSNQNCSQIPDSLTKIRTESYKNRISKSFTIKPIPGTSGLPSGMDLGLRISFLMKTIHEIGIYGGDQFTINKNFEHFDLVNMKLSVGLFVTSKIYKKVYGYGAYEISYWNTNESKLMTPACWIGIEYKLKPSNRKGPSFGITYDILNTPNILVPIKLTYNIPF